MRAPFTTLRGLPSSPILTVVLLVAVLVVPAGFVAGSGPSGALRGFITSGASGTPIAGATVQLTATSPPWSLQTTTDANGFFAVSLTNNLYTADAWSAGFYVNSTSVRIGSGQTVWMNMSLNAAAGQTATVQGYVRDSATSAAITLGEIVVAPPSWASDPKYQNASGMNATGFYRVTVTPGTYQLSTYGVVGYAPYTYSYLYLSGAQVRWFNLSLTAAPLVAWINGTVENQNNYSLLAGATVLASIGGSSFATATSDANGTFSIHAPVATVTLLADAVGFAPGSGTVYIYSAGQYSPTLYLAPLDSGIHGTVRNGLTGAGIPGALVVPTPIFSGGYYDQAAADASGAFTILLPQDYYSVTVTAPGFTSWYSYAYLYTSGVLWVNATLWPIVATVRGYVIDGATSAHIPSLGVYASDSRSGYAASTTADVNGAFTLTLPPSPAISLTVYGYPPYTGAVAYISTRAYATVWANLTLPRDLALVHVNVTDGTTGLPISGAGVGFYWTLGSSSGLTDATGLVDVNVAGGLDMTVSAWALGYLAWYGSLPAVSTSADLSIALYPGLTANVTVQGYVRSAATNNSITFALIQISGYGNFVVSDYTDSTGYYELTTVPFTQTIKATASGYAPGLVSINPAPGSSLWANLSLSLDGVYPQIMSFTATPATNLGPSNPASLVGQVNETNFGRATMSILMLRSSSLGVGTFLNMGALPAADVTVAPTTPGNQTVSAAWDTRTPALLLTDGVSSDWWPVTMSYRAYLVAIYGTWDNATLGAGVGANAYFDSRTGNLLYVSTGTDYITAADQPMSTFQPSSWGVQVNLATGAVIGSAYVLGSTYRVGSLHLTYSSVVPGGDYAALLETWDAGGNYARRAATMQVTADTTPPVALAGPDQSVNQGSLVTFDGSASTDDTGIVNYTWTFTDGTGKVLYGVIATYTFQTPGTRVVTLIVRDAAGNLGSDSLTVTVRDTMPPTVTITAPVESANVSGTITLMATATDNVGVTRVEFRVDGVAVGTATSAPFQLPLNTATLSNGAHTITATAYDAAGNSATSTANVTVFNAAGAGGSGPLGMDLTVWLVLIVVVAAVAVGLVLLAMRRRRRAAPRAPPPSPPPSS